MKEKFTFIDLFAGIGGMRTAFEKAGGRCVFSSEIDKFARQTYEENFGDIPHGDITKISSSDIPSHDILLAGFPCQPFSLAGVSKKNSMRMPHGFKDSTQGTLFFEVARIIEDKRPKAFLLENVKNLKTHDGRRTYSTIMETLNELKYYVADDVIDATNVVPQHRERIYIAGFRKRTNYRLPEIRNRRQRLSNILEERPGDKYTLTDGVWKSLKRHADRHKKLNHGFGYGMVDIENKDAITRTLSARYYKDGAEILIPQKSKNPRRLTPRECAKLMGFPSWFKIPVSDNQAYRQFGNSVVVPVVKEIAKSMTCELYSRKL